MKNILITAVSGNIGSQIVKIFQEQNIDFIAGVTSLDKSVSNTKNVLVDFNNKENLIKAFEGVDTLFLLYAMGEKMIDWNKNAVDAAKIAGVKHIVRSSGAGADSHADFLMPRVQGTIDDYIKNSGIDYTITRPAAFMQNFETFMTHDIKNGTVYQPLKVDAKLNWVDVRDIAAVNAAILLSPYDYRNQEITISGNDNLSYNDGLQIIAKAINNPIQFVTVPDEGAIEAMKSYHMSQFNIDMMMSLNAIINLGYAAFTTTAVIDITGKEPITFEQFVNDYKLTWI